MLSKIKTRLIPFHAADDCVESIICVLEELAADFDGGWITFSSAGSDRVVEVAFENPNFTLNIPHAEKFGLLKKLDEAGFAIPSSWTLKQDKQKTFLSSGFLEVQVGRQSEKELAVYIHRLFRDFLRWPLNKDISASLQK